MARAEAEHRKFFEDLADGGAPDERLSGSEPDPHGFLPMLASEWNDDAWRIALRVDASSAEVNEALQKARRACRVDPTNAHYWNTCGALLVVVWAGWQGRPTSFPYESRR